MCSLLAPLLCAAPLDWPALLMNVNLELLLLLTDAGLCTVPLCGECGVPGGWVPGALHSGVRSKQEHGIAVLWLSRHWHLMNKGPLFAIHCKTFDASDTSSPYSCEASCCSLAEIHTSWNGHPGAGPAHALARQLPRAWALQAKDMFSMCECHGGLLGMPVVDSVMATGTSLALPGPH
jgi:hypothetical protein